MMDEIDVCPMGCGGRLILMINKDTEELFIGCSNFPKCSYTESVDEEDDNDDDLIFTESNPF